jgi:KDO2-lipid IV(A) lauroyltransferase
MMVRALAWLVARTPLRLAWALGWFLAWTWWLVLPIRRRTAAENLAAALPGVPPGPALRRMMAGLVLGYFELLGEVRAPGRVQITYSGQQAVLEHLAAGRGAFLLAAHYGSWDLLGPCTNRDLEVPATTIVKIPAQPAVAALMEEVRLAMTMELLPPRGCMPEVYRQLEEGRLLVFLLDQRHNKGIPVPFFGRPAWTSPALASAAARTGLPVFTLHYFREGVGRHRVEFGPPLALTGQIEEDTRRFQCFYESRIRERPHNWLWLHNRWKTP